MRLSTGWLTDAPKMDFGHLDPRSRAARAGLASMRPTRSSATIARGRVELRAPRLDGVVAHGHLEGGLCVAACGRVAAGHQCRHQC